MLLIITYALVIAVFSAGAQQVPEDDRDAQLVEQYVKDYEKLFGTAIPPDNGNVTVNREDVKFILYNAPGFGDVANLDPCEEPFAPKDAFNSNHETIFYIHDWLQEDEPKVNKFAVFQFAIRGKKVNFVSVDWSQHSRHRFDVTYSQIVPKVAGYVQWMVSSLAADLAISPSKMHVIGLGVGAHIAGLAGKKIVQLGRITGLSPFGPYYDKRSESERLAKGDASFVDVIHTNMGHYGISKPVGDIDFFPAGGKKQPAAGDSDLKDIESHLMAKYYFMESIDLGLSFMGKHCESYREFLSNACLFNTPEVMGEYNTRAAMGKVFLEVNAKKPYGKGVAGEVGPKPSPREEKNAKRNMFTETESICSNSFRCPSSV